MKPRLLATRRSSAHRSGDRTANPAAANVGRSNPREATGRVSSMQQTKGRIADRLLQIAEEKMVAIFIKHTIDDLVKWEEGHKVSA